MPLPEAEEFEKRINDDMGDYLDSIHAMIGFINFYRYDDEKKQARDNVKVRQGRKLDSTITDEKGNPRQLTPDFIICLPDDFGILGEVKKSFPRDRSRWIDDFRQLKSYDEDLSGWPTKAGKVSGHDIVLLTHLSRSREVSEHFVALAKEEKAKFLRNFCIIEFNRSDERQPYIFFRKEHGILSQEYVENRLKKGVQVPMEVFIKSYGTTKLYDSEPPTPYLILLIWEYVIFQKASEHPKFRGLKKNQRIEIKIQLDEVVAELAETCSFKSLHQNDQERQPTIPHPNWVERAFEALIKFGDAKRNKEQDTSLTVYFKKIGDPQKYMISKYIETMEIYQEQPKLF